MAALLTAASTNGAGTGVVLAGAATVYCQQDSVFNGAEVSLEISDVDTAAKYIPTGKYFFQSGAIRVNVNGAYYLRAVVYNVGKATSLNINVVQ